MRPLTRRMLMAAMLAACAVPVHAMSPVTQYKVISRLPLDGAGGWDYLSFDAAHRHLFVTRGDRIEVIDVSSHKRIATIPGTQGVHGVALDLAARRGYASNGATASVTVFDLDTLAVLATIKGTGEKPDAIVYDSASRHVLTFNGNGKSFSVIDPGRGEVTATIPLPGKPEFAVSDGAGHVYVNLEDRAELARIDSASNTVSAEWPLEGCESPSGLAMDRKSRRLFSVCDNKRMTVTDADAGKVVARVPIGEGPDAVVFDDDLSTIFTSNGESGDITAVREDSPDHYTVVAGIATASGARTLALDPDLHRLYLSVAKLAPVRGGRPVAVPGSFEVLTVGRP